MNYRVLFFALFCACVVARTQGGRGGGWNSYPYPNSMSGSSSWHSSYPSSYSSHKYPGRSPSASSNSTIRLSELRFETRLGLSVDISLPRISHTENCTFITPDNRTVRVEDNDVAGVTTYDSSEYVSCRIVVGPMEKGFLGIWTICGSYTEDNVEHKRCQEANIVWRDSRNPSDAWETTTQPNFEHVVYFGGTLSPSVRSFGKVISCHLVTPNNEDLLVTPESEYPGIKLVQNTDSTCTIAVGPIKQSRLGSWTIYGTFKSPYWGYNEVRLPMNFSLYNKNHPYDQAYNVTNLSPIEHFVYFGNTIEVEVPSAGAVDVCMFTMPSGMSYNTIDPGMPTGVAFVKSKTSCRMSIGPISQNLIGPWLLYGKFSNGGVFTEMRQRFTIIERGSLQAGTEEPGHYYNTGTESWRRGTEKPGHNYNTGTASRDWSRYSTTVTPPLASNKSHLYTKPQSDSDKVVLEVPRSLALDQDVHFALSLVPMLRSRNLRDKLNVQVDILKFFKFNLTRDGSYY